MDVRSSKGLAQVKFEARLVGAPVLQRLAGAREREQAKGLLFFSGSGYAAPALAYADRMEIALFKYDLRGQMTAVNNAARRLVASSRTEAATAKRAAKAARPGRGWLGRNWNLLLGLYWLALGTRNGLYVLVGEPKTSGGAFDVVVSLTFSVLLLVVWCRSGATRARWKRERATGVAETQPT